MPDASPATHSEHADPASLGTRGALDAVLTNESAQPVRWREFAVVGLLVVLFDLVIYRGHGYAGAALGFVVSPLLLWAGSPQRVRSTPLLIVLGLLVLLAARMFWLGTAPQGLVGVLLIAAFAMTLSGRIPYVLDTLLLGWQVAFAGAIRLPAYTALRTTSSRRISGDVWLRVLLPAMAVLVFGVVFVLANPDLRTTVERVFDSIRERLDVLFGELVPTLPQFIWWCVVVWTSVGLLRPILFPRVLSWLGPVIDGRPVDAQGRPGSAHVPAFRNTLIAVISLFAVYLVFEFQTLWNREFPQGFYYAGYAHEGAAWLTVALALATLVLSTIFRGGVLSDERLPGLKRLAWGWSVLNILLAAAVYHRLLIYIDFNGMTRMRGVGIVGVTTVLAGFLLVVWKIARHRGFVWLIERQLWALALGLYVLAVLPMDAWIHRYNVACILQGRRAPAVQITEHDIDVSGLAALTPLLDCDDPIIREGISARLADEWFRRQSTTATAEAHWTAYQQADCDFRAKLAALALRLDATQTHSTREAAWERLRKYAYQWY